MNRWLLLLVGTLFFTALATVRAATPPAAFILVTTTDDVTAHDGLCSFLEADTAAQHVLQIGFRSFAVVDRQRREFGHLFGFDCRSVVAGRHGLDGITAGVMQEHQPRNDLGFDGAKQRVRHGASVVSRPGLARSP